MKVLLTKRTAEGTHILVIPNPRSGFPPVMLKDVSQEAMPAVVAEAIRAAKGELTQAND